MDRLNMQCRVLDWKRMLPIALLFFCPLTEAWGLEPADAFERLCGRRLQCTKAEVTAKWTVRKSATGETYGLDLSPQQGLAKIAFDDEVPIWQLKMERDQVVGSRFHRDTPTTRRQINQDSFLLAVELENDRYFFNPFYMGAFLYTAPRNIRPPRVNFDRMYPSIHPRMVGLFSLESLLHGVSHRSMDRRREWSKQPSTKCIETENGFQIVGPSSTGQQVEYSYDTTAEPILSIVRTIGKVSEDGNFVPAGEPWAVLKTEHREFGKAVLPIHAKQVQTEYKEAFKEETREPVHVLVKTVIDLELDWEHVNDNDFSLTSDYQSWGLPSGTRVLDASKTHPSTIDRITVAPIKP
ncbi:hypothetical protein Mal65_05650 [Crateriforma conspicua]|nr:hypothetical protein Mal65_05650 [Crateriforma conspicua]